MENKMNWGTLILGIVVGAVVVSIVWAASKPAVSGAQYSPTMPLVFDNCLESLTFGSVECNQVLAGTKVKVTLTEDTACILSRLGLSDYHCGIIPPIDPGAGTCYVGRVSCQRCTPLTCEISEAGSGEPELACISAGNTWCD